MKDIEKNIEKKIMDKYENELDKAKETLMHLEVAIDEPNINGLNGWVFEETIRYFLQKELDALGLSKISIESQKQLEGGKKVDFVLNDNIAIEVKKGGIFGKQDAERYKGYFEEANEKDWCYLYITGQETHPPYKQKTKEVFGKDNCFFLDEDEEGEWRKFIERITQLLDSGN